jgi:hypothetical protein
MELRKTKRIGNLFVVKEITQAYGNYIEFKLFEKLFKQQLDYKSAEGLAKILSFITSKDVLPDELLHTEDETANNLIDKYNKLKESYLNLKNSLGLSQKAANKIFAQLSKSIVKMPTHYVIIPRNCDVLTYYILGLIDREELKNNFIVLCLTGNHKPMKPRVFYHIYSDVLKSYQQIAKPKN